MKLCNKMLFHRKGKFEPDNTHFNSYITFQTKFFFPRVFLFKIPEKKMSVLNFIQQENVLTVDKHKNIQREL